MYSIVYCIFPEMHFIPVYMDKLTEEQRTFVRKRVQQYSKQSQYYAHTYNPKAEP